MTERVYTCSVSGEEKTHLQGIARRITDVLTESVLISTVTVCGSFGKQTAVRGITDLDMVATTVKFFESELYISLQQYIGNKLAEKLGVRVPRRL